MNMKQEVGASCVWQSEERRCAAVLLEVFSWLSAEELARAGAACRAWRRAAAAPHLWRRLLRRLAPLSFITTPPAMGWRQEYVSAAAGWRLVARHGASDTLLHAALAPGGARLALAATDASLAVWERRGAEWRECGRVELRARGWSAVARVHWAPSGGRLLLAGPLALVDDWELLVLSAEDDGRCGAVVSRVRCSAGAAGCWADVTGDAFLSLELRRLGLGLYCTTVWLNSATQETQSEYAGVTMPLLRIYNEDGQHITHAFVADAPRAEHDALDSSDDDCESGPSATYLRAIEAGVSPPHSAAPRVLVAAAGCRLATWLVCEPRPAPLLARAAGELAERLQRHRERLAEPEDIAQEPDEATVRAACTSPARSCSLTAPIIGIVLHEHGRCMWAVCSDGSASCVSLALQVLCRVRAPGEAGAVSAHYVQPAVSASYVAWPAGGYSARVWCCAAASGARGAAARHGAAAVGCVLPPSQPATLLVLAGDELYEWQSRATRQCGPEPHGEQ